jgi:hypothetical protein
MRTSTFHKKQRIAWLHVLPLASEEGLSSLELVLSCFAPLTPIDNLLYLGKNLLMIMWINIRVIKLHKNIT